MPIGVGRVFRTCVTYNQIRFWTIHPSPLKSFLHVKVYFLACVCVIDPKSPSWCSVCWSIWLLSKPNHLKHTGVFCRSCESRSDIHFLETCYLNSRTSEWTPLTHPTLFQKTWGKSSILRTQTSFCNAHQLPAGGKCYVCMQPGVYSFVLSLPRELFLFYQCLISLSEVILVVGRGWEYWGILRPYCRFSKLLGLGWDGVMCGFAFIVLFTKVIVLFCIVV